MSPCFCQKSESEYNMFFKNARIYTSDFQFRIGAFEVTDDGRFGKILPDRVPEEAIDLEGATVIPGLVDVHIHGAMGADFSDGDAAGLEKMARFLAQEGITSFAPASMTLPYETLEKAYACGAAFAQNRPDGCARLMGIHMEGPYFSEKKKGAQNGAYLKNPDFEGFKKLYDGCGGLIAIADVAPELPGAEEFVRQASKLCTVSLAHTDSGYADAKKAYDAGATHLTHTFNAMPPIQHRNPGVIPAAAENENVRAELICDGYHVLPSVVRLAFSLFGSHRIVMISDGLRCCGMPEGEYELGGQTVYLSGPVAKLADGTVAGSVTNLFEGLKNVISYGIPEENAIRAATYNPACAIHAQDRIGSICEGRSADFLICSGDYSAKRVFIGGKEL